MSDFSPKIRAFASRFEIAFEHELNRLTNSTPGEAPERLLAAMRHGSLNGGKRLRPLLVVETASIFGIAETACMPTACAVEMIHCYSLIHDDLPAMDNDDLRRGQATVHIAFDDATAILAGDSLLTHAFGTLANPDCHNDPTIRSQLVTELVAGSGVGGMAGGQMRDIEGERGRVSEADIAMMQAMKTGALIRASVRMGAVLGSANDEQLTALTHYGEAAGRAFQLADDLLDVTASPEQMGKATGKDSDRQKPTLVARIGVDAAQRHLGEMIHNAITALTLFGPEADGLRSIARYFAERQN